MIVLFTDFGLSGPYTGQVKAVLAQQAPGVPVIDLFADAPAFDPQLSAYLLAAYAPAFPAGSVFVCVVDPGVGTDRRPLVVEADGRLFIGPDNGLFEIVGRRAAAARAWTIEWQPDRLSASFHGRDLFAPVAARLATGQTVARKEIPVSAIARPDWPDDLARIVYVDVYGNAMTGLRASQLPPDAVLSVGNQQLERGRTFADAGPGGALWYGNSNGLAEIAVNRGRADTRLGLRVGSAVTVGS
ncbi:S-adenosyl-l-methionine hydroxide adenosyltransferase family protein [Azospirillum doebereinerae]|uniref:SAM hydrolase/SAM-dependent halogenase family protein n=1 Tax=Azospirillum doebereinerae TaxID=92933 RepID=UPI001EE52B54|nr:SAM-dependent chlorinase/fluorinase [Azospirillum doebereinerae]MCG5243347.1 SAM-dependent chlorinase/fluorinase [Azospirillum doebereinerae]